VTSALPDLALARAVVDRDSGRRSDRDWLAAAWADPATRVLRLRGGRAAKYVRGYRRRLYAAEPGERPGPGERRAARRELSGRGLRDRLRLLLLMPPGGPRARR